MAYQNTGYARRKILTVTKGDYSQDYNFCSGFTYNEKAYPSLSDEEFARLSEGEYQARLADFCNYVYGEEDGLEDDCPDISIGSVVYDPVSCPLPMQTSN